MSTTALGVWGTAIMMAITLSPAAAETIGALPGRYECTFQPLVGGQLIDGAIISPNSGQFAHLPVAIVFVVENADAGAATMQFGKRPDRTVPARLEVLDRVVRFSYEFPGLSAGAVTISRIRGADGFPAVRSDQGWYSGTLSVGYSSGVCRANNTG